MSTPELINGPKVQQRVLIELHEHGGLYSIAIRPQNGILILRVMKAERLNQLLNDAVWDESLIGRVPTSLFELLLRYILAADIDKEAFETKIQGVQNPATRANAMSLAQAYRQEGRQEGEAFFVIRLLQKKFPALVERVEPRLCQLDEEHLLAFAEALFFMQPADDCMAWFDQSGR